MSDSSSILAIPTSWGPITIKVEDGKVTECDVTHAGTTYDKPLVFRKSRMIRKGAAQNASVLKKADLYIRGLFNGKAGTPPPVDLPDGTDFQKKVWRILYKMKPGQTMSYGEIARKAGKPRASRAAGQACGANRIPLIIPCHRIVTSDGRLGGFSCGLAWKEKLLEAESGINRRNTSSRRRTA